MFVILEDACAPNEGCTEDKRAKEEACDGAFLERKFLPNLSYSKMGVYA